MLPKATPATERRTTTVVRAHITRKCPSFLLLSLPACISRHLPGTRLVVIIMLICASELRTVDH
jgi:hypothetical protein